MALIETGTVCFQRSGRKAGNMVVVLELQKNQALVEGVRVKRRKVNVLHLHPTSQKLEISKNASREDIVKQLKTTEWKV